MLLLKFLLAAFLVFHEVAAQCGPPQCYQGCTDARPQVDFVFLVDVSGSMQPIINGVKNGLTAFANSLDGNKIIPKFSIVLFGRSNAKPYLSLDMTDFADFKKKMDSLSTSGAVEGGLESLSTSMNAASAGNLGISFRTGQNTKKVFILVTNEDSDYPYSPANVFSNGGYAQSHSAINGACYPSVLTASQWVAWQKEIDHVANNLISRDASLYMFVRTTSSWSQVCNTVYQYCNPGLQQQASDYGNFNGPTTLNNLKAQSPSQANSLQGKLLSAGKTSRCFDVADTSNSNLVNNFFSEIVSDVSKCEYCYAYECNGAKCLAPRYVCDCAGVRNGKKVTDVNGACCESSELDCAGVCSGGHKYDTCGVCTPNGNLYPLCKEDCNKNRYLDLPANPKSIPTYANLIYKSTCPDDAGYLLPNADLIAHYKTIKTRDSICTHFHTYGRFEKRPVCEFDTAKYQADYAVLANQAKEDWLSRLLTASPRTAHCKANTKVQTPPLSKDNCDQCIISLDSPPTCTQDCNGAWKKPGEPAHFTDNCGYCVAHGSNPDAKKDDCGVCDGGNALKNECDVCNGIRGLDGCENPKCEGKPCIKECDGEERETPTMDLDDCGYCVNKTAVVRDPKCVQDCANTWYKNEASDSSPAIVDECGNCVPRSLVRLPTCVQDCNGTWAGDAFYDSCNQCVVGGVPPYPCLRDCNGTYYREGVDTITHTVDDCGFCTIPAEANLDKDACGICRSKAGYNSTAECTKDCKGVYRLIDSPDRAFEDFCDDCWLASEPEKRNYNLDACGFCWDSRDDPNWNKTTNGVDSQGKPCKCNTEPVPCADNVTTTCSDDCPEFNFCPGTTIPPDFCGRCPGNPHYNQPRDECGVCCDPSKGVPCNQDKDDCGVCFGFNRDKTNPCGVCLNIAGNICVPDCAGVYNGNATYGCDGVCNSDAVCTSCGNGIVEEGESCDLGSDAESGESLNVAGSGCTPTCTAEVGKNTGKVIGGVIGGVAAVAFLALAAFLAVKYAQKAGLIGSANKQVDMGASNTNPLYKSEVAVHQNPLYETS